MKRLLEISKKTSRLLLGLMSGTAHDGVDATIAEIRARGQEIEIKFVYHFQYPFDDTLRAKISKAFSGTTEDICRLNFELGEVFAKAALICIKKAGLSSGDIDAIASHGQTIYHIPPEDGKAGSTLQIGEASVIAERTGIMVISDFRTRDMAAGGHGAPLVPLTDYIMFRKEGKVRVVNNIGGIANITVVTDKIDDVIAFDTGPGVSLINEAVRIFTEGEISFDRDGMQAEKGVVINKLLDELLGHAYFKKLPPKSTGRETFGKSLVANIIERYKDAEPENILATLTNFTALSIQKGYRDFVFPKFKVDEIILCGGGSKNRFLVKLLSGLLSPTEINPIEKYGIPSQAKEALSFAVLANETLSGRAGNIPGATGAEKRVVLGKITL
ncbi:MAG: anhydro-N-acetylmuramic acid kinase [Nitrospirae bacterium]|nr:anhydro-N-acetylmuramic acid kinase [Nitrospirota bacterium]